MGELVTVMGAFPLRVLLVENQPIMAAGVECVLKRLGHLVVGTAATGEAAIIAADKTRPDFVLMDVVLDGAMDGIEAAEEIRKHHGIRSVFLSDRWDQTTRVRAQAADGIAFIEKTAQPSELAAVVTTIALLECVELGEESDGA